MFVQQRRTLGVIGAVIASLCFAGCATPGAATSATVWLVSGAHDLAVETEPSLENEIYSAARGAARLTAAINETVAFQIALRSDSLPSGPVDIVFSDFEGPAGKLDAESVVSIYRAHWVAVDQFRSWYPLRTGKPATPISVPDILVPWDAPRGGGPLRRGRAETEIVWVDIFTPPDTPPGSYTGRFELRGDSRRAPAFTCELTLDVLPVEIPRERSLQLLCRVDPRDLLSRHLGWPDSSSVELRIVPHEPSHAAAVRLLNSTMRLFHEHGAAPLLWGAFPKYRLVDEHTVEIEWDAYDELVSGWLNGDAFDDNAPLTSWALPATDEYPNAARNGGFQSARYARLLAAYVAECRRHFAEKGWLDRAFLRISPPGELSRAATERLRRTAAIVRQSESHVPIAAHLPVRSLKSLGWFGASEIGDAGADIWAPRAGWYEPEMMRRQRDLGRRTWFMPGRPPYSGSLAVEAPAVDARILPWQAFRYGAEAIWIEHAAEFRGAARRASAVEGDALIYSGVEYGLDDQPVPSMRLKRLRRGLLDHELLMMLRRGGKPLLATRAAEQVARWAFTDACAENLLSTRGVGWPDSPYVLELARRVLLRELAGEAVSGGDSQLGGDAAQWSALLNQTDLTRAEIRGVRLLDTEHARIFTAVDNGSSQTLAGQWEFPQRPEGWSLATPPAVSAGAGGRSANVLELTLAGLTHNADGVYPLQLAIETQTAGTLEASGRLAIAACPMIDRPLDIDGDLSDWDLAFGNVAGDFLLVRGQGTGVGRAVSRRPALATQAFFCMGRERLYVAVRCRLKPGEKPQWRSDNAVPIDGAIPWGQDVVEILLDPRNAQQGTGGEIYCLQVKPSGLLIARRGCLTDPPMNASEPWESGGRAAVRRQSDAWIVELALPLSSLDKSAMRSRVWGCNVTRLDAHRGEYSSWSGARGHAYSPERLGNLVLLRP